MPIRHITWTAAALLLIGQTAPLRADDPVLGPERRVFAEGALDLPAVSQYDPIAASNGRGGRLLTLWHDGRAGGWTFALREDGSVVEPLGLPTTVAYTAIASDGLDYLAASRRTIQKFDENGIPVGEPRVLDREVRAMAWNGSRYLVAFSQDGYGEYTFAILDRDGRTLTTTSLGNHVPVWAGAHGSEFLLVAREWWGGATSLLKVNTLGVVTMKREIGVTKDDRIAVAASPSRILVAWMSGEVFILDLEANVVARFRAVKSEYHTFAAAWDGRQFLLAALQAGKLSAMRISTTGPIDRQQFILSTTAAGLPAFASNGMKQWLFWPDSRAARPAKSETDIIALGVDDFDALANATTEDQVVLSRSKPAQLEPRIARTGSHELVVWYNERSTAIEGTLNGAHLSIVDGTAPRCGIGVAAGDGEFLVTWQENTNTKPLFGIRVDVHGRPLDPAPILLAPSLMGRNGYPNECRPAAVAYANGVYLILAQSYYDGAYMTRLDKGRVVYAKQILAGLPSWGMQIQPHWFGGRFVIVLGAVVNRFGQSGSNYGMMDVILEDDERLQTVGRVFLGDGSQRFVSGVDGSGLTLVRWVGDWSHDQIDFLRLDQNLHPTRSSTLRIRGRIDSLTELAWNGTEYVLAWFDGNTLKALRFNREEWLDHEPFVIAPRVHRFTYAINPVSMTATPDGVTFAYSRPDPDAVEAPRAFTRTLLRDSPFTRRRAVR